MYPGTSPVTMRETEEFSLPESRTSASGERDAFDVEQSVVDAEQTDSRQMESKRTKLCVLIGSGILQLPIWGTFGTHVWIATLLTHVQALL
jgi:hypothetical protein